MLTKRVLFFKCLLYFGKNIIQNYYTIQIGPVCTSTVGAVN